MNDESAAAQLHTCKLFEEQNMISEILNFNLIILEAMLPCKIVAFLMDMYDLSSVKNSVEGRVMLYSLQKPW